jgi:putative transposase
VAQKKVWAAQLKERQSWIAPYPELSIARQCELLGLSRSRYYYLPQPESAENLALLRQLDELYLQFPYYGSRKFAVVLSQQHGQSINRKRIQRLMDILGIEALCPKPNLSRPAPGHQVFPYLLRGLPIARPNQVWSTDITYVPMRGGFLYLAAVLDWFSRFVLSWELSNTLDTSFCRRALENALRWGQPEIFNTDQGAQFTALDFQQPLRQRGIRISMDGRGRALDNVFIERLWRSVKYELIYPGEFASGAELATALARYFHYYNHQRPHQSLNYATPARWYGHHDLCSPAGAPPISGWPQVVPFQDRRPYCQQRVSGSSDLPLVGGAAPEPPGFIALLPE